MALLGAVRRLCVSHGIHLTELLALFTVLALESLMLLILLVRLLFWVLLSLLKVVLTFLVMRLHRSLLNVVLPLVGNALFYGSLVKVVLPQV